MAMEMHNANKHDSLDNVDQHDDVYADDDISHAFIKSADFTNPKESAEFRARREANDKKAREWK